MSRGGRALVGARENVSTRTVLLALLATVAAIYTCRMAYADGAKIAHGVYGFGSDFQATGVGRRPRHHARSFSLPGPIAAPRRAPDYLPLWRFSVDSTSAISSARATTECAGMTKSTRQSTALAMRRACRIAAMP